jgi:hypothetical protein
LVIGGIVLFFFGVNMVLGFFRWRGYAKRFRRKVNPKVQEALADGRVEVKRVEAKDVIELEEFEDEGPGWIFDLGDGQCLVLKGQTFYPTNEQSPWPNDQFELVRTSKHGLQVGIFCSGKLLEPSQRISTAEFPEEFIWGEMEATFQGSPAQVVKVLQAR